ESSDDSGDTAEPLVDPVVFYVDASNADDLVHNGTADHPFADLPAAFEVLELMIPGLDPAPPFIIEVAQGTYLGNNYLRVGGHAKGWITIRAADGALPVIDGGWKNAGGFYSDGDYVAFEGFEIQQTTTVGVAMKGSWNTVRDCVFHDVGCCSKGKGISWTMGGFHHNLVERNTFINTGEAAIKADGMSDSIFRNNAMLNEGGHLYNPGSFIDLSDASKIVIENNYMRAAGGGNDYYDHAILLAGGTNNVVRHNLLIEGKLNAIELRGTKETYLYNNTLVLFDNRGRTSGQLYLSKGKGSSQGNVVKNNLFSQTDGLLLDLAKALYPSDLDQWIDGNVYWKIGEGEWFRWPDGTGGTESFGDISSWQAASGFDQQSTAGNPMLLAAEPASQPETYAPQKSGPAFDSAVVLTTTVSSGSAIEVVVVDSRFFTDGMGVRDGDLIRVGKQPVVRITSIDHSTNKLTLESTITYDAGDPVNLDYVGEAPDVGALESGGVTEIGDACESGRLFD
ncbi:MAG: right-handed parallel beta-helix repeat-containing protein, partial [Proteobacteria bacterium]|nr:right-handed parallel beta-helix repeat-containing protein [Pseudomonadota bacterium]